MRKHWNLLTTDKNQVEALTHALGISPLLCSLLVQRGITTYESAKRFFRPSFTHLHDPFLMKGMSRAVARLSKAIDRKEGILLYGDYDVDGVSSVSLMHTFLNEFHEKLDYYIPDRYQEGYGLSLQGVEYARTSNASLMIVMDCGIKAIKAVQLANKYGIDCIICDHHIPETELPPAYAILDPKQTDCTYPYKELTGCGIAFKLAQAYQITTSPNWQKLAPLLDILVVSIACDIVPITGENRVLAHLGLKKLNENPCLGLRTLIEKSSKNLPFSIRDIVFGIGPAINAAGRLASAKTAVQLLLTTDEQEANIWSQKLFDYNNSRRLQEQQIVEAAKAQFANTPNAEQQKSLVLYQENWHKGILGIVAARMVEYFYKPTIVLTKSKGHLVGSARTIRNFDLYNAISKCSDLLVNYGGHKHAAGLTLLPENLAEFRLRFEKVVAEALGEVVPQPELDFEAYLSLEDLNADFWNTLKQFAPFGPENWNPVFVSEKVQHKKAPRVLKEKHLMLTLEQNKETSIRAIGFGLGHYGEAINEQAFDICYNIQENTWQGKTSLQLNLKDLRVL